MKKLMFFAVLFAAVWARAQLTVDKYDVAVTVSDSPRVLISQDIYVTVGAEGFAGPLYRDVPVVQTSAVWTKKDKDFALLSVLRDGKPEAYTVKDTQSSKRIFLETPLAPGSYKYSFLYRSTRIRSYEDADELYLRLDKSLNDFYPLASGVAIKFPPAARQKYLRVFVSEDGVLSPAAADVKNAGGALVFAFPPNPSAPQEHIIELGFEKGFIQNSGGDLQSFFYDNFKIILSLLVFALAAAYYIIVWACLREKEEMPREAASAPPPGVNAAQTRYIYKKIPGQIKDRYKMLTSALLELASAGYFKIIADGEVYKLVKAAVPPRGKPDARAEALLGIIFPPETKVFLTSSKSVRAIRRIIRRNRTDVKREFKGKYIRSNSLWDGLGYALGAAGVLVLCLFAGGGLFYCLSMLALMAVLTLMFRKFFPPFTEDGARLVNQIMNFRRYLMDAGGDQKVYDKEFSKYLPYAVALGVENKWARRFEERIERDYSEGRLPAGWLEINFNSEVLDEHRANRAAAVAYTVGAGFVEAFSRTRNVSNAEDLYGN